MFRSLMSWILSSLLSVFILTTCGGVVEESSIDSESLPHYTVLADQHLQSIHKEAILAALNDWATKTNYTFKYNLKFIDMSTQSKDTNSNHTIKIFVANPGQGLVGWTAWHNNNESAYILVAPNADKYTFKLIMLHALGHAFDLQFGEDVHYNGPYQSVMYPGIGDTASEVSCPEITSFCSKYGCQVDCDNLIK